MSKPIFTAREAREHGVHPSLLSYYAKTNRLIRLSHGVYQSSEFKSEIDFQWEDLVITMMTIPNGTVCLLSALAIYNLTDEIPREYWIAIPNKFRAPKRPRTHITRIRNISLGKTTVVIGNQEIAIFDRERTIVDAFRYLTKEIAIKALKLGLQEKGAKKVCIKKLRSYAKKLRCNLDKYILAIIT